MGEEKSFAKELHKINVTTIMKSAQQKCYVLQKYITEKSKPVIWGRKFPKGRFSGEIDILSCNLEYELQGKKD